MSPLAAIALLVCASAPQKEQDPVLQALFHPPHTNFTPVTEPSNFDKVLAKTTAWSGTKFPKLATELRRFANPSPKLMAEVDRLYKEYFTKPVNPNARALFGKRLEEKDARKDLADAWLYMLLKPSWASPMNGNRETCLDAALKCDEERVVKIIPEYWFANPILGDWSMSCFVLAVKNPKGIAMLREIYDLSNLHPEGTWTWTFLVKQMALFLRRGNEAWTPLLLEELKSAKGDYAKGISKMLGFSTS